MEKISRQENYRQKLISDGWRQKNVLLDPESLSILEAMKPETGSDAETIRQALQAISKQGDKT